MTSRAALLCLAAAACAPRFDPRLADAPIAGRAWVSTEHRSHPLAGRILHPRSGGFVDEAALTTAVTASDFVLLGETHDNPDHHLLQARLVREIASSGRRPAVAFEMLTVDQQGAVDAALARAPGDPDALAEAVAWDASGWPEFRYYRPIFAAALGAGMPIVAANLPRATVKRLVDEGVAALDAGLRERLAREEPLPDAVLERLRDEMRESHCGVLPDSLVDPLVLAQRARDAQMAERMLAAGERGAVLVTGSGHARVDRGVPSILAKDAPSRTITSIAMIEVTASGADPDWYARQYGDGPLPFDYVVFTPGEKRSDPCEGMHERMKDRARTRAREAPRPSAEPSPPPAAPADAPR